MVFKVQSKRRGMCDEHYSIGVDDVAGTLTGEDIPQRDRQPTQPTPSSPTPSSSSDPPTDSTAPLNSSHLFIALHLSLSLSLGTPRRRTRTQSDASLPLGQAAPSSPFFALPLPPLVPLLLVVPPKSDRRPLRSLSPRPNVQFTKPPSLALVFVSYRES